MSTLQALIPIKVIYRDSSILAAHKPAGIPTYLEGGSNTTNSQESQTFGCKEILEEQLTQRLFPVHRIDADTEGVVVFALDSRTASALIRLFKEQKIRKTYLAWCVGEVPAKGSFTKPLKKKKSTLNESARTDFERLKIQTIKGQKYSNVRVFPHTGRFHQIRRHFHQAGFPLVGDPLYGSRDTWKLFFRPEEKPTLMLFAESVAFEHPVNKKKIIIKAKF